jgi:hypothetical protein
MPPNELLDRSRLRRELYADGDMLHGRYGEFDVMVNGDTVIEGGRPAFLGEFPSGVKILARCGRPWMGDARTCPVSPTSGTYALLNCGRMQPLRRNERTMWISLIVCCSALSLLGSCAIGRNHTPDAVLERRFLEGQADFEALLAEVQSDAGLKQFSQTLSFMGIVCSMLATAISPISNASG